MSKYGLDKFYTKESIVDYILSKIDLSRYNSIIDPSAGAGAFSNKIDNCYAYDIMPEQEVIEKSDFLNLSFLSFQKPILVIGNPPFGRNSSLALAFIKKASEIAQTIAFILPRSFRKSSMYDRIPLDFVCSYMEDLPDNAFTYNGEDVSIPCVFAIYERTGDIREKSEKRETDIFSFVAKEDANVAIRRVGVYAGRGYLDTDKSKESHYFVSVENPQEFVNKLNSIEWEHDNTVGPRSVSKNELIEVVDKLFIT